MRTVVSRRFRCGSARDELGSNVGTMDLGMCLSVPLRGKARVLLSLPRTSNATDTRSPVRDPSFVQSHAVPAAPETRLKNPVAPHSIDFSVESQKRPKKTPLLQLAD